MLFFSSLVLLSVHETLATDRVPNADIADYSDTCEESQDAGWASELHHIQDDVYNYLFLKFKIKPRVMHSPDCVNAPDFSGTFRVAGNKDCSQPVMECEFGRGHTDCLDNLATIQRLDSRKPMHSNRWGKFYLCRQINSPMQRPMQLFKEYSVFWDIQKAVYPNEIACQQAGIPSDPFDQYLYFTHVYGQSKKHHKGVLCVRYKHFGLRGTGGPSASAINMRDQDAFFFEKYDGDEAYDNWDINV